MLRVPLKLAVLAAAVLAASAAVAPAPAHAKNNTAAIVGGIIAGAAVGAAISSSIDHPKKVYVPGPPPRPAWDKVYKPNNNIWCYPAQRACYNRNGVYDAKWTYKVYAR